jgi:hypothetical protein
MFYKFSTITCCAAVIICSLTAYAGVSARPIYDYDGDGRSDFAVIRLSGDNTQFTWFILQSRDGFSARNWGYQYAPGSGMNDVDASGDFDGDGKWDVTVRRAESGIPNIVWYVQNSHDNSMTAQQWGLNTDTLVPQDYDGDGKTDFGVFREGWWYILRSSDGQFQAEKFGLSTDTFAGRRL